MRQIWAKVGLIVIVVFALALIVLFFTCSREVKLEPQQPQQSPQPQQSAQPEPRQPEQQPLESAQPQRSPQPKPQQQAPPQPPEPEQSQQPEEPHVRAIVDVRSLRALLDDYKNRTGAFPTTAQGLGVLGGVGKDPWGNDYIYQFPSTRGRESYDLFSAGPDHQPDTPDDDWGEMEEPGE